MFPMAVDVNVMKGDISLIEQFKCPFIYFSEFNLFACPEVFSSAQPDGGERVNEYDDLGRCNLSAEQA